MRFSSRQAARFVPPVLIIGLGVALFAGTLHNPFTSDDVWVTIEHPQAKDLSIIPRSFVEDGSWGAPVDSTFSPQQYNRMGFYRPLLISSFAINAFFSDQDPFGWRLTNLLLHIIAALLVLGLARNLLASRIGALAAALLFVAHPVHTESVANLLGGRGGIMVCIFVVASWWMFLAAERHTSARRWALDIGSAFLFLLGLFSKENAIVIPAILFLCGWTLRNQPTRTLLIRLIPHATILALYLVFRISLFGWIEPMDRALVFGDISGIRVFLTIMAIMTEYLHLVLLPYPLQFQTCYNSVPASTSLLSGFLFAILVIGLIGIAIWQSVRVRRQGRPSFWAFGLLLFFLCLVPVSHLIPFPLVMAERLLYLPSVALCLVAGYFAARAHSHRWWILPAACLPVLAAYAVGTLSRNADWTDLDRLYGKVAACDPTSPEPYNNMGTARLRQGQPAEALPFFEKAAALAPEEVRAHYNIGVALQQMGRHEEAEQAYLRALSLMPKHTMALLNLGTLLERKGDWSGARDHYVRAIEIDPDDPYPYVNLGNLVQREGRHQKAEELFRKALRIGPGITEARFNLARLLGRTGRTDEAERLYLEILDNRPDHAMAHNNLANILKDSGRPDEAESHYRAALIADPDCSPAHFNFANLYLSRGDPKNALTHYEKALSQQPEKVEVLVGLGYARLQLGQVSLAIQAAQRAKLLAPGHPAVKKLLLILTKQP